MHARFIPRLLTLGLMLTLVFASAIQVRPAVASDRTQWSETESIEDGLVESCYEFNVTGSYTVDRVHQLVENYFNNQVFERQIVSFSGTLGNVEAGETYAYDGGFIRTQNLHEGSEAVISNLSLRFEIGTPGEFTYKLNRADFLLRDDPHGIVKAIVPYMLQMDICQLFGGSSVGYDPIVPSSHPSADMSEGILVLPQWVDDYTEHPASLDPAIDTTQEFASSVRSKALEENLDAKQDAAADDDLTPWTELDPCDTTPPGKPC